MPKPQNASATRALLLLLLPIVTGCAALSKPTPPAAVSAPAIPPPPPVSEPPSSAALWTRHCQLMQRVSAILSTPLPMSGPCAAGGQPAQTEPSDQGQRLTKSL